METYTKVPWDLPQTGEGPSAFYATIKNSITDPVSFFDSVGKGEGFLRPWLYAVIISIIVFACVAAYQAGFAALQFGTEIADAIKRVVLPSSMLSAPLMIVFFLVLAAFVMPVATTVGLFIQAGLYHLGLRILGSAKRDFSQTFRTVCYSFGPQVFQVVPIFGGLIAGFWVIVLNIIGLKVVHDTTYARSAITVFLPLIICCGLILLIITTILGGVFAAIVTKQV